MTDWTLDWRIYPWGSFNSLIAPPPVAPDADGENLSLCINRQYLPYLLGAIAPLTFPDFYTGDSDAQALAANYFQQVFYMLISAGACPLPFDVRQNTENPCLLEKSDDGGATWTTFANLQLCPPLLQLGQGGVVETSSDGGATYTPIPAQPPDVQPTPPVGQDQKCLACQNAVNVMAAFYVQVVAYFNNSVNVIIVVTGFISLVAIMIAFPVDFPFALAAFTELWGFMTTIVSYEFSSDDQATFLCDLYNNATLTDGVVTFDFSAVIDAVDSRWFLGSFNQWTLISYLLQVIQSAGLNNAATVQSATAADCSGCGSDTWCYEWSSTADMLADGWTNSIHTAGSDFWAADFTAEMTDVSFTYTWDGIGGGGDSALAWWRSPGFTDRVDLITPLSGNVSPYVWTGDIAATAVQFGGNVQSGSGGGFVVTGLHLEGIGSLPGAWTHGTAC